MENNWAELTSAFDRLAPKSQDERQSAIESLKSRNPELAAELSSLLIAHDKAEGFFETKVPRIFGTLAPDLELANGERVLHFEILELLGEGSLAKVYLAQDTELGRNVALKVTFNQSKEAETLAHFSLDGIIQVYSEHVVDRKGLTLRLMCLQFVAGPTLAQLAHEMHVHRDTNFSFMQLLDMRSQRNAIFDPAALKWRDLLSSVTLPEAIVLLGMKLSEILSHAHALGVLHLDIKPANILIDHYGRPYLSDFNVSTNKKRLSAGDIRGLGGTPHYMPPEQQKVFENKNESSLADLTEQADVFSLGTVIKDLVKNIDFKSDELNDILTRATELDPNHRTKTARDLAEELSCWVRRSLAEKEMPRLWSGFGWIKDFPLIAVVTLVLASQVAASIINIAYNQLQIMSALSPKQNELFMTCVLLYNLLVYPFSLIFSFMALRPLVEESAPLEEKRIATRRVPVIVFIAISIGWLPGAYIFPRVIDIVAGPIPQHIYGQFIGSFSIAWLISMTTSLTVTLFVLARALYPKYWRGRNQVAAFELRYCEKLNRYLTFSAALVPLGGVLMVLLMSPAEFSPKDYGSFKMLLMSTVGFGLLNIFLVQRLTQSTASTFAALKRPHSFD